MKYMTNIDRKYIENKYHNTNEPFDPFNFRNYHGYEYDVSTGLSDGEILKELERLAADTADLSHPLAKAKAFSFILDNTRIDVSPSDYFVGLYSWGRLLNRNFFSNWYEEEFEQLPYINQQIKDYNDSGTAEIWLDTAHVVPSWNDILDLGFRGILDRAKTYKQAHQTKGDFTSEQLDFIEAIEIEYEAILRLILRYKEYAQKVGGEKAEKIAESMERLYIGAPQNTFDALETIYLYFICSDSVDNFQVRSLGHGLDRSLYKFYIKDIEDGRYSREEIRCFLSYFFMQFSAMGNYWGQPFYLCGTAFDETTDITDLSLDILEAYEDLNIYNPKIQLKIDYDTDKRLIFKALNMIRNGITSFVFCCVPGITKSLMSCYGANEHEARNCDISGCNEMHVRADEANMISALPNMAKAICYVFNNGIDTVTGKQLGLKTGEMEELDTFERFFDAFVKQGLYICDSIIDSACVFEPLVAEISPSLMLSGAKETSLIKGVDAYAFGMKYCTSSLLLCSFATAVDSLLSVKELVYDKKEITLKELKTALANNWEGYEDIRIKALKAPHKYGNNDPEADKLASAVFKLFSIHITGRPNGRGGVFKVGVPSTLHFISYGKVTEATPDGRKMGEELSKNAAPVIGMERKGVTAMIRSALKTDPYLFSEAYVLDVMLHPTAVAGDDGIDVLYSLLQHYMKSDGISIQFNIFDTETLRDAQKYPERYQNLQVRISGWNTLWNNMSKEEQEAYIVRANSIKEL